MRRASRVQTPAKSSIFTQAILFVLMMIVLEWIPITLVHLIPCYRDIFKILKFKKMTSFQARMTEPFAIEIKILVENVVGTYSSVSFVS